MQDGEVTHAQDNLVQQVLVKVVAAVPDEVAGDVTELQRHPFLTQGTLKQTSVRTGKNKK